MEIPEHNNHINNIPDIYLIQGVLRRRLLPPHHDMRLAHTEHVGILSVGDALWHGSYGVACDKFVDLLSVAQIWSIPDRQTYRMIPKGGFGPRTPYLWAHIRRTTTRMWRRGPGSERRSVLQYVSYEHITEIFGPETLYESFPLWL
jgi:hypothetical protein